MRQFLGGQVTHPIVVYRRMGTDYALHFKTREQAARFMTEEALDDADVITAAGPCPNAGRMDGQGGMR